MQLLWNQIAGLQSRRELAAIRKHDCRNEALGHHRPCQIVVIQQNLG